MILPQNRSMCFYLSSRPRLTMVRPRRSPCRVILSAERNIVIELRLSKFALPHALHGDVRQRMLGAGRGFCLSFPRDLGYGGVLFQASLITLRVLLEHVMKTHTYRQAYPDEWWGCAVGSSGECVNLAYLAGDNNRAGAWKCAATGPFGRSRHSKVGRSQELGWRSVYLLRSVFRDPSR